MSDLTIQESVFTPRGWRGAAAARLPYQLAARMANVMLTAQVQIAYACAIAARDNATRAADCIEQAWPDTPLRSMVARAYRAQACERANAACDVLARARRHCGLAYAAI
jgi:hypothetical protein